MKPLTHLFVDFENHQPRAEDFARVHSTECRIWLFHGPHQNRFAADLVAVWQPLGERVRFVQSSKAGKNALDFHIAFALGLAQQEDLAAGRSARYVVVSKDSGFDALFDHMRTLRAAVGRAETIADALVLAASLVAGVPPPGLQLKPAPGPPPAKTSAKVVSKPKTKPPLAKPPAATKTPAKKAKPAPRDTLAEGDVDKVIAGLRAHPSNRPADRDALQRHIVSLLRNQVTAKVSEAVIKKLEERKVLAFSDNKIDYQQLKGRE